MELSRILENMKIRNGTVPNNKKNGNGNETVQNNAKHGIREWNGPEEFKKWDTGMGGSRTIEKMGYGSRTIENMEIGNGTVPKNERKGN